MQDDTISIPAELLNCLTAEQAWHYMIVPGKVNCKSVELFCPDSSDNEETREELELILGKKVVLIPEDPSVINRTLSKYYLRNHQGSNSPEYLKKKDFLEIGRAHV